MYFDKNDNEIKAGMFLIHIDGWEAEEVFTCGEDGDDLGFDATNHDWSGGIPTQYYYPLSNYDLNEWIIQEVE